MDVVISIFQLRTSPDKVQILIKLPDGDVSNGCDLGFGCRSGANGRRSLGSSKDFAQEAKTSGTYTAGCSVMVGGARVRMLRETVRHRGAIDKRRAEGGDCKERKDNGWAAHVV